MPIHKVTIHEFLKLGKQFPILDARSPSEYAYAHIPGAFSFPIFTDEQRKEIGTCYKQVGRQQAIKIGALSGLTVFFANGTVIFPPSTYTIPAPAPGKKFKAFCPSSGVILISGDIS
jgi:rhodanese-related sulfurtransferase